MKIEHSAKVVIPDELIRGVALGCATAHTMNSMLETDPLLVVQQFEDYIRNGLEEKTDVPTE